MADTKRRKASNVVVWVILGLLIFALAGFGASSFGGSATEVATVGDREVTMQDYANALRNEQLRVEAQTGERPTLQQLQAFGLDRQVIERLLAGAALEDEAARIGLSVGDAAVAEQIRATDAFQGFTGGFDRDTYRRALEGAGLAEASYERRIRDELARELLQAAVVGGTEVPRGFADRIAAWLAETRDVTIGTVRADDLRDAAPEPTEAELAAFYEADPEPFRTPERRALSYAWITPDALAPNLPADDDTLRALYEERGEQYRQPERVLAERLAFADEAAATRRARRHRRGHRDVRRARGGARPDARGRGPGRARPRRPRPRRRRRDLRHGRAGDRRAVRRRRSVPRSTALTRSSTRPRRRSRRSARSLPSRLRSTPPAARSRPRATTTTTGSRAARRSRTSPPRPRWRSTRSTGTRR